MSLHGLCGEGHLGRRRVEVCMGYKRGAFKFVQQPQATAVGISPEDTGHPKWHVNILLVGNRSGFESFGTAKNAEPQFRDLKQRLIQAVNDHAPPSEKLTWDI
jgi:hypothetical protein